MSINQLCTRFTTAGILATVLSTPAAVLAQTPDDLTSPKDTNNDLFHCDGQDFSGDDVPTSLEKIYPATVLVRAKPAVSLPFNLEPSSEQPLSGKRPPGEGTGSGFVIDPAEGYIVTNTHVILPPEGKERDYTVTFYSGSEDDYIGQEVSAELIAMDSPQGFDLALLKVDLTDVEGALSCVTLGDSDNTRVGERLVAIGAPMGLSFTATFGYESHGNRSIPSNTSDHEYIQTDASINRGNSGGPLFALEGSEKGSVIAVNTLIFTVGGGSNGLGFSIPSNVTRDVINRFIEDGEYLRGWLGAGIRDLTEEEIADNKLSDKTGIFINNVTPDGPAIKGGLKSNDIVTGVSGEALKGDAKEFARKIRDIRPETIVDFTVIRDGETIDLQIEISDKNASPDEEKTAAPVDPFMQTPPEEFMPPNADNDDDDAQPGADVQPDSDASPQPDSVPTPDDSASAPDVQQQLGPLLGPHQPQLGPKEFKLTPSPDGGFGFGYPKNLIPKGPSLGH